MLQLKVWGFAILAGLAMWFRMQSLSSKLETKSNEVKSLKRNRKILVDSQEAMFQADMKTKEQIADEIKQIKAGNRDNPLGGWDQ